MGEKIMKKGIIIAIIVLAVLACSWFIFLRPAGDSSAKAVRIGTDATWPPFEMVDETTKELTGFDIELVNAIAEAEGFKVEFVNINFDALVAGLAQCQYDAGASAISVIEERKETMLFSDPYFAIGQIMSVKGDVTDLVNKEDFKGKTIGAQTGTTGAIMIQEWESEGLVTYKGYDTIDLAFMDLKNGQIDGVLTDNTVAEGYVNSLGGLKTVGDLYSSEDLAFAVCKTQPELQEKFNEGLKKVKESGKFDELVSKYLG